VPRGQVSEIGSITTSQNGYQYIRTETGWRLRHHVIAEEHILRRPLEPYEIVRFRDGNKKNIHPDNLLVARKGTSRVRARLAKVISEIQQLEAERDLLMKEIEQEDKKS
jgi:hypothetical protein